MKTTILALLEGCLYALAVVAATATIFSANEVSRSHQGLSQALSPEARTEAAIGEALERVTLGLYDGAEVHRQRIAALNARILDQWQRATHASAALAGVLALLLILGGRTRLTQQLLIVSAVCLAVGILAPMLSIVAQREIPLLGHVVLRYESKGVLSTVSSLQGQGNFVIALLLGVFSILIPVAKVIFGLLATIGSELIAKPARRFIHLLGRWSMTDVFVVSVLLSFLAGGAGDSTDAWLGHGLWFFAAYAVLALVATRRIETEHTRRASATPDT
ncbi:MAG: hypothetical protein HOI95_01585 [Chromatiales bacterium]|jgi:paraquat-inducible protein A|nr:hypothetical protein [Chromatiales bacterium]